ncbi:unnamed protein product [Closterium sp. Yama58-4]|nr:unnamed protein product [Closterium sp. Yama58-4]CAI5481062.1 unnamed protein product [Closterium sp. Yama58-4]
MAPRSPWTKQLLREHHAAVVTARRLEVFKQNAETGRVSFERTQQARGKVVREGKRVGEHKVAVAGKRKRDGASADGDCHGGPTTSKDAAETGRFSGSGKSRRLTAAGRPSEITASPSQSATSRSCPEGREALLEPQLRCLSSRGTARASSTSPRPSWAAYFHAKLSQGLPLPPPLLHSQDLSLPLPLVFSRPFESPDSVSYSGECGAVGGRQLAEACAGAPSASVSPYARLAAEYVVPDLNLPAAADDASDHASSGAGDGDDRGGVGGGDAGGADLTAFTDCGRVQSACESDGLDGRICNLSSAYGLVALQARSCESRGADLSSNSSKSTGSQYIQMQQQDQKELRKHLIKEILIHKTRAASLFFSVTE